MGGPGTAQAAGLTCRQASPPHLTSSHELPETHASGARLGEPAQGRMKGHPQGLTHPPKSTHASQTPSRQAEREIHVNTEPPTAKGSRAAAPKLQVWGEGRTNSPRDPWDPGRDPWDPRRGPGPSSSRIQLPKHSLYAQNLGTMKSRAGLSLPS